VIAIEDVRLDDRAVRPAWTIQALTAATLLLVAIGAGWLMEVAATDDSVRHVPAMRLENQTHLPLQLTVLDRSGAELTLGAHEPGASTVYEVVDMGPVWTFVASYAGREVFRQAVPRAEVESRGWSLVIPASTTADLERQGFR
jgi:hypothetical protein